MGGTCIHVTGSRGMGSGGKGRLQGTGKDLDVEKQGDFGSVLGY